MAKKTSVKIAIIDCGTNTFNLLLAEKEGEVFRMVHEEKIPVKIGKGGIADGLILPEAAARAIAAMQNYAEKISAFGAQKVLAIATAAFRRARNGEALKQEIRKTSGISITTITGEEEARYIARAALHTCPIQGNALIMDIGGGSTEFILCQNGEAIHHWSFDAGASRLIEDFQPSDPMLPAEQQKMTAYLQQLFAPLLPELERHPPELLIGASGFYDSLAEMAWHHFHLPDDPRQQTTYAVSLDQFRELDLLITPLPYAERLLIPGLIPFRADMIVVSFLLARVALEMSRAPRIVTTGWSLKEGVMLSL